MPHHCPPIFLWILACKHLNFSTFKFHIKILFKKFLSNARGITYYLNMEGVSDVGPVPPEAVVPLDYQVTGWHTGETRLDMRIDYWVRVLQASRVWEDGDAHSDQPQVLQAYKLFFSTWKETSKENHLNSTALHI